MCVFWIDIHRTRLMNILTLNPTQQCYRHFCFCCATPASGLLQQNKWRKHTIVLILNLLFAVVVCVSVFSLFACATAVCFVYFSLPIPANHLLSIYCCCYSIADVVIDACVFVFIQSAQYQLVLRRESVQKRKTQRTKEKKKRKKALILVYWINSPTPVIQIM